MRLSIIVQNGVSQATSMNFFLLLFLYSDSFFTLITIVAGRPEDDTEVFYLGMTFPSEVPVKCIYVRQDRVNLKKLRVQALTDVDTWSNVYIEDGFDTIDFTISW